MCVTSARNFELQKIHASFFSLLTYRVAIRRVTSYRSGLHLFSPRFPSFDMVVVICRVTSIDNPCVVGSSPTLVGVSPCEVAQLVERRTTVPYYFFSTTINEGAMMPLFLLTFNTFYLCRDLMRRRPRLRRRM